MNIKNGRNRLELCPASGTGASARRLGKLAYGISPDEATPLAQVEDLIQAGLTTDILDNTNTWTGANTYTGAVSLTSTVTVSDAAGIRTNNVTPRSAGSGTALQAPVINWTLDLSPAVTQSGAVIYANAATTTVANTITLPACATASIGTIFKVKVVKAVTAGGTYVINTTGTDVFLGGIYGTIANNSAAGDSLFAASTTNKTITLSATTQCGLIGGWIELTMISATQWSVSGMTLGSGAIATPFSN